MLIAAAVDDQAVVGFIQPQLIDEALGCADHVCHEGRVVCVEGLEIGQFELGHQQNVDRVIGFGVFKRDQCLGLA